MIRRPRWIVHRYQSVTSTMDVAARLAAFGAGDRTAIVSDEQTAGRGRSGRAWQAPAGSGLFCTLLLRPEVDPPWLSTLPLLVGVAVAEAIETLPTGTGMRTGSADAPVRAHQAIDVRLKWPNDVWIGPETDPAKAAGVLVTSRLTGAHVDYVLVGIGVNVLAPRAALPPGATSLRAAGVETTVDELFARALARFEEIYGEYLAAGGRAPLDAWRSRAALIGEKISIEENGRARHGTFVDVDDAGALILQTPDGATHRIVAGDLVRGPARDGSGIDPEQSLGAGPS